MRKQDNRTCAEFLQRAKELYGHYEGGLELGEIAQVMDIQAESVRRIETVAINKLKRSRKLYEYARDKFDFTNF
ncbi:MAG: hypothetical protein LBH45_07230 [Campylobacteraceae bacterium]|jgi:DNA-directed RNA polymerase sigma subunit (sigma70/sigma32)|nr:hypothetical protein [Campylobacteraceae bacterium]